VDSATWYVNLRSEPNSFILLISINMIFGPKKGCWIQLEQKKEEIIKAACKLCQTCQDSFEESINLIMVLKSCIVFFHVN